MNKINFTKEDNSLIIKRKQTTLILFSLIWFILPIFLGSIYASFGEASSLLILYIIMPIIGVFSLYIVLQGEYVVYDGKYVILKAGKNTLSEVKIEDITCFKFVKRKGNVGEGHSRAYQFLYTVNTEEGEVFSFDRTTYDSEKVKELINLCQKINPNVINEINFNNTFWDDWYDESSIERK